MSNKSKRDSPLVKSVLALDDYLTELERVGTKINSTDMTSDFDVEYIQKLMARFVECGRGISEEVAQVSTQLNEARARAESVAQSVSSQAELFNNRKIEQNERLERFRMLGEKVRELNAAIGQSGPSRIADVEAQLAQLIEELQDLRESARNARMKTLEKNAESLAQTLQALQKKLRSSIEPRSGGRT